MKQYHELTLECLLKAMPSLTNSINILSAILQGYSSKFILDNKQDFNITLTDCSLSTTISRLRRYTKQ